MSVKEKVLVFSLTFLCVASRHTGIQSWFMMKAFLSDDLKLTSTWLGAIDTLYLFGYSIGLYISGVVEDKYSMKLVVSLGMILGSIIYYILILGIYGGIVSPWFIFISWCMSGFVQSAIWPGVVSIMGNWFPRSSHGKWLGLWSTNANIGNILGNQVSILIFSMTGSWEYTILTASTFMLITALLTYFCIEDRPIGISPIVRKGHISFTDAWKLPGVFEYACSAGCIKLLNLSILMWIPYYLFNYMHASSSQVLFIVASFDLIGIIGAGVAGEISDRVSSRGSVMLTMIAILIPILLLFLVGEPGMLWIYYVLVPLSGFLIVGSMNLVVTSVSTDLAYHTEAKMHTHAMATVAGIIDGTGSLGAASGQILIGWIQNYSWDYVFFFTVSIGIVCILLLIPPIVRSKRINESLKQELIN